MTILIWHQAECNWSSSSKCLKPHYYQMVMHSFAQSWHLFVFRSSDFNYIWLCVRQHVSPWGQEKWSHGSKVSLHQHHCCLSTPPLCLSPLLLYLFLTGFLSRLESNPALATAAILYYKHRPGVPLPPSSLASTSVSFRTATFQCSGQSSATFPPEAWLGSFPKHCQVV